VGVAPPPSQPQAIRNTVPTIMPWTHQRTLGGQSF
jgi:hypothetical protein